MQTFPWSLMAASVPFLAAMGFTPGPNNIMVASSGVNFGFRATIPHMLGITLGFPVMLLTIGLGLAKVFLAVPQIHVVCKYLSIIYLLYLAWRVAKAGAMASTRGAAKPLTFWQGAAFQWINVKALIIAVSAVTTYTAVNDTLPLQICVLAVVSIVVTMASASTWTLFGHFLRNYLCTAKRLQAFNYGMAAVLVISILPVFWE